MREFVLLFRMDIGEAAKPTQQQMQEYMNQWTAWINAISAAGKLAEGGNHLQAGGRLIRPKEDITYSPYTVHNESVAGYIIILANDMDDATNIARQCPILNGEGTSVEIRQTATM